MRSRSTFSQDFYSWQLHNKPEINITRIESFGDSVRDLILNAIVYFEDWHGNPTLENWGITDLPAKDYETAIRIFAEHINQKGER
jgi:hypothetical protein